MLYRQLPIPARGILRAQQSAGPTAGLPWGVQTQIELHWQITVDAAAVTVRADQPAGASPLPPITVWPAQPDTDRLLAHAMAVHAWWPCLRWADTLNGAARTLGRATEPDLDALADEDQLAVSVPVASAIRRAARRIRLARPTTLTGDAVENGILELTPIRDQLTGPDAIAATQAVGPPAGLGDTTWTRADPRHRSPPGPARHAGPGRHRRLDRPAAQQLAETTASGQRVSITTLYLIDPPAWATPDRPTASSSPRPRRHDPRAPGAARRLAWWCCPAWSSSDRLPTDPFASEYMRLSAPVATDDKPCDDQVYPM